VAAGSLEEALDVVPAVYREKACAALAETFGLSAVGTVAPIRSGASAGAILRVETGRRRYRPAFRSSGASFCSLCRLAPVSSHNDPVPANILFDGRRPWLIDWEWAYRNDPLVDVAIVLKRSDTGREAGVRSFAPPRTTSK
jgi:hypothetical protein